MDNTTGIDIKQCKNCSEVLRGDYCYQCGQKIRSRLTVRRVIRDLWESITNVDHGFLHTVIVLFTQPGQTVCDYISGRTRPYMNPLRFAILLATVSVLLNFTFGIYEDTQSEISEIFVPEENAEEFMENQQKALQFIRPFMNFIPILLVPATAFFFRLFTRSRLSMNYAEHMVAGFFGMGQLSLIGISFIALYLLTGSTSIGLWIGLASFGIYFGIMYRQLSDMSWTRSFAISMSSIVLGYVTFMVTIMVLTILVMLILAVLGLLN